MLKSTPFSESAPSVSLANVDISQSNNFAQLTEIFHNPQAPIRRIQKGRGKAPFFFLHGDVNGGPFYCVTLARTMGRDQPFYALDPYIFSGPYVPQTFSDMAAVYVKAIRAIQPEGPYFLGGFCNGALVAHEMARQLQEHGQQVALLLLITPSPLTKASQLTNHGIRRIGRFLHISERTQRHWYMRIRQIFVLQTRKMRSLNERFKRDIRNLMEYEPRLKKMFPPMEALYKDYGHMYTWLVSTYTPTFRGDSVKLIWSSEEATHRPQWRSFEQADVPVIPGPHMACVTDQLDQLAELMKSYVEGAQRSISAQQNNV